MLRKVGFIWGMLLSVSCHSGSGSNGSRLVGDGGGSGGGGGVHGTNIFVDTLSGGTIDKLDLLFMVDNSIAMADKEEILKATIPDLMARLVSPNCVDSSGKPGPKVADPAAACPAGLHREMKPLTNVHVGVITSSLGDHGDHNTCNGVDGTADVTLEQQDDHGHLIATRPRFAGENGRSYAGAPFQAPESFGFLDWNPVTHSNQDITPFNTTFQMMVTAANEFGCGLESQLESIFRFLVDPNPPLQIVSAPCPGTTAAQKQPCAMPSGRDDALLAERAAFLRPDSLVAVVMLTDENDCSIRETQQFFYAARQDIVLPNGSSVCAVNPNDKCCYSCAASPPAGCAVDPACAAKPDPLADSINLRCFEQKRRFGLDFLYPTPRYVNALRSPQICTSRVDLAYDPNDPNGTCPDADANGEADVVANPLYVGTGGLSRAPGTVFLEGIVGVPWQDIAAATAPDGTAYPASELHYQPPSTLGANGIWSVILGDPSASPPILPTDGLMMEARAPRSGSDELGQPIPGPSATLAGNNAMNHHDWANVANDDLMYACIFPLTHSRDCSVVEQANPAPGCDCGQSNAPGDSNPLCQDPATGTYGTTQFYAKAYPSLRELRVLKDLGDDAIVASVCARNLKDQTAQDYAYRPAMDALVERLVGAFQPRCLPRVLPVDGSGNTSCRIIEALPGAAPCDPERGRKPSSSVFADPARATLEAKGICNAGSGTPSCADFQLCEIQQAGASCHQAAPDPGATPGFCYIDPAHDPNDDPALVAQCPASEQRMLRFVDPLSDTPAHGAVVLLACAGSVLGP